MREENRFEAIGGGVGKREGGRGEIWGEEKEVEGKKVRGGGRVREENYERGEVREGGEGFSLDFKGDLH